MTEKYMAYDDDQALAGPDTPPMKTIMDVIRYCITVHERFGNTCVADVRLKWGACALNSMDASKKDTARMDHLENEPMDQTGTLFRKNMKITRQTIDAAIAADRDDQEHT
jgi:hypothetical protein